MYIASFKLRFHGYRRDGTWETADASKTLVAVEVADNPIPILSVPATIR